MKLALVGLRKSVGLAGVFGICILVTPEACAQAEGQKTFGTPREAVAAFVQAARHGNSAEAQAILGPDSEQIISSGDDVADKNAREKFVADYEAKHSLLQTGANQLTLDVGEQDWPVPIPLVRAHDKWYWDGAAGREEILYRRIGHNELAAIEVCNGVVAAQREYASAELSHKLYSPKSRPSSNNRPTLDATNWTAVTGRENTPSSVFPGLVVSGRPVFLLLRVIGRLDGSPPRGFSRGTVRGDD